MNKLLIIALLCGFSLCIYSAGELSSKTPFNQDSLCLRSIQAVARAFSLKPCNKENSFTLSQVLQYAPQELWVRIIEGYLSYWPEYSMAHKIDLMATFIQLSPRISSKSSVRLIASVVLNPSLKKEQKLDFISLYKAFVGHIEQSYQHIQNQESVPLQSKNIIARSERLLRDCYHPSLLIHFIEELLSRHEVLNVAYFTIHYALDASSEQGATTHTSDCYREEHLLPAICKTQNAITLLRYLQNLEYPFYEALVKASDNFDHADFDHIVDAIKENFGAMPLSCVRLLFKQAIETEDIRLLRLLLLSGYSPALKASNGKTIMHMALAESSHVTVVQRLALALLQEYKSCFDLPHELYDIRAILAIIVGDTKSIHFFVDNNTVTTPLPVLDHDTPLHLAVLHSNDTTTLVKHFLERGALVASVNDSGHTPLQHAAQLGYGAVMRCLLKTRRCLINNQDILGDTALHDAASYGYLDCVKLLLRYGADPAVRNGVGKTALDLAKTEEISALLRRYLTNQPEEVIDQVEAAQD